jgi:hypothetical protein
MEKEKRYVIRAAVSHVSVKIGAWTIYSYPIRFGHHFWLLVEIEDNQQEKIIEAIHGLATQYILDRGGAQRARIASPLGTWNSQLKAYCVVHSPQNFDIQSEWTMPYDKNYWIEPHETFTKYDKDNALDVWNSAKAFSMTLNDKDLPYSFCGMGRSLGLRCRNSNSVYATIAEYMGLEAHRFGGYKAPGLNTPLLSQAMIKYNATVGCIPIKEEGLIAHVSLNS